MQNLPTNETTLEQKRKLKQKRLLNSSLGGNQTINATAGGIQSPPANTNVNIQQAAPPALPPLPPPSLLQYQQKDKEQLPLTKPRSRTEIYPSSASFNITQTPVSVSSVQSYSSDSSASVQINSNSNRASIAGSNTPITLGQNSSIGTGAGTTVQASNPNNNSQPLLSRQRK
jgi:hypothetical protein